MKNEIKKALNISIALFSLAWVCGFYVAFIAIISSKMVNVFSIYDSRIILFRVISAANFVVVLSLIYKYISSLFTKKWLKILCELLFFAFVFGLIIIIFSIIDI